MLRLQYFRLSLLLFFDSKQIELILAAKIVGLLQEPFPEESAVVEQSLGDDVGQLLDLLLVVQLDIPQFCEILEQLTQLLANRRTLLLD